MLPSNDYIAILNIPTSERFLTSNLSTMMNCREFLHYYIWTIFSSNVWVKIDENIKLYLYITKLVYAFYFPRKNNKIVKGILSILYKYSFTYHWQMYLGKPLVFLRYFWKGYF